MQRIETRFKVNRPVFEAVLRDDEVHCARRDCGRLIGFHDAHVPPGELWYCNKCNVFFGLSLEPIPAGS